MTTVERSSLRAAGDPPPQDPVQVGLVDDGLDVGNAQLEESDDI